MKGYNLLGWFKSRRSCQGDSCSSSNSGGGRTIIVTTTTMFVTGSSSTLELMVKEITCLHMVVGAMMVRAP